MNTPILESRSTRTGARARVVRQNQNEPFIRQGEWFFIPAPHLVVDEKRILRAEPIRRSSGEAHIVEQIFRSGGEAVYYSEKQRRVLTVPQYRNLLRQRQAAVKEDWRIMQRDLIVYGRGTVRHPDHGTLMLPGWHRILTNTASATPATNSVAFPE